MLRLAYQDFGGSNRIKANAISDSAVGNIHRWYEEHVGTGHNIPRSVQRFIISERNSLLIVNHHCLEAFSR